MKDDVVKRLKEVEEKLQNQVQIPPEDLVFLFGLSLIKDKSGEN
jgi:hypothetical protein